MTSSGSRSPRPGPRRRPSQPPRRRRLQQPSAAARGDMKALRERAQARRSANALRPGGAKPPRIASQNERYIAIAAVAVLLVVGFIALISIATGGDESDRDRNTAAAPTTTAAPSVAPTASPSPNGLTPAGREDRREALATVRAQGYEPLNPRSYKAENRLRVLVGRAIPSAGTTGERAFFFFGDEFIGTDAEEPSAGVEVLDASQDLVVTLRYDRFASGNAEPADVRYRYQGGKLVPLDPVPPAQERAG